jgi:hypothetical protein
MQSVEGSARVAGSDSFIKTELYYLLEPAPGSYNVVVTYNGSVDEACGGAVSLRNVGQQPPEAVTTNAQPDDNSISTGIVTLTDYACVVDVVGCDTTGNLDTTVENMIRRCYQTTAGSSAAMSTRVVAAAGPVTNSWNHNAVGQLVQSAVALPAVGCIISGYIQGPNTSPISDVFVSAEHSIYDDITDSDGYYQMFVPYGWSGTVNPTKTGCIFSPAERTYCDVTASQINQNYQDIKIYDLDCDGSIGYGDFGVIDDNWLDDTAGNICDFNADTNVNFKDYAKFTNVWRAEYSE